MAELNNLFEILDEGEFKSILKDITLHYLSLTRKESMGKLFIKSKELLKCSTPTFSNGCKCSPTNCRRAYQKLQCHVYKYIKTKCTQTFEKDKAQDYIVFQSRVDKVENNPLVHSLKEMEFNLSYIDQWLQGVNFTITVFKNYTNVEIKSRLGNYQLNNKLQIE